MINLRPKFMTANTFKEIKASMAECEKCHAQWRLAEGKRQIMSRCTACQNELIFALKSSMGTLPKVQAKAVREAVMAQ